MKICANKQASYTVSKRLLPIQRRRILLPLFSYKTVVILSMLSLTACMQSTLPNLAEPLPAKWQHQPLSAQFPAPDLRGWWKAFNAPDLDALVDQSLAQNLTLAAAREHIHAARVLANKNSSNFLPDLHIRTGEVPAPNATSSYVQADIDTTWELGLFGKKTASQQIADGQLADVEAQAQMARVSLVAEVVRAWITLRTAQQQVKLLDQLIQQSHQQYELTTARINLGLSARSAVFAIKTSLAQQSEARQAKQLEIEQALQQLALLQGRSAPDPAWTTATIQPVVGEFSVQTVPADVIRIRPDIQQAQASVLQAAGQFGVARAARYPSISLAGSYVYSLQLIGRFSFHTSTINGIGAIGPIIDIPLFDWGMRKATADARHSELKAAVLGYRQTVLEAVNEVESSLASMNTAKYRIDQQYEVMRSAKQALKARHTLINLGLSSSLEGLDEQQAGLQAEIELSSMQKEHDLAYVAVYKALGGAPLDASDSTSKAANENLTDSAKSLPTPQQQGG